MTDFFAPSRNRVCRGSIAEELKEKYHQLTRAAHPDAAAPHRETDLTN